MSPARRSVASVVASVLLASLAAAPSQAQGGGVFERGRTLTDWLVGGDVDALVAAMAPSFTSAVGGRDGLARLVAQLEAEAGAEVEVIEETAFREAGHTTYYRVSRFENLPSATARWVWDSTGAVVGASVNPTPEPAPSDYADYETRAPLRLPFGAPEEGTWYVAWGGRNAVHNYHVQSPDQRYASDYVVVRGDNEVHTGDGSRNEDHYCWGEPVYAPAAGRVVTAVDTVADNARPGVKNAEAPPGNYVVVDHGAGEHSLLAHFRRGSVAVREGDEVAAGALLGECGNSGNSSLPHVHVHLQTGPAYAEGVGLPAEFGGYYVGGAYVEEGEPVRGQVVVPGGFE